MLRLVHGRPTGAHLHPSRRPVPRCVAGVVAVVVALAACSPTPTSSASPSTTPATPVVTPAPTLAATVAPPSLAPSPSAAPVETEPSGAAQCEPADLKASHGRVEGAAGSRFTTVELVAAFACSVDLFPAFGLLDADGAVLVGSVAQGAGRLDLVAGESYESNVRLGNWCADEPAFPLTFELHLGAEREDVTGGSFPEQGDLPPCNGDTIGPILEATSWEAVP